MKCVIHNKKKYFTLKKITLTVSILVIKIRTTFYNPLCLVHRMTKIMEKKVTKHTYFYNWRSCSLGNWDISTTYILFFVRILNLLFMIVFTCIKTNNKPGLASLSKINRMKAYAKKKEKTFSKTHIYWNLTIFTSEKYK